MNRHFYAPSVDALHQTRRWMLGANEFETEELFILTNIQDQNGMDGLVRLVVVGQLMAEKRGLTTAV